MRDLCSECKLPMPNHTVSCVTGGYDPTEGFVWRENAPRCNVCGLWHGSHRLECPKLDVQGALRLYVEARKLYEQSVRHCNYLAKQLADAQGKLAVIKQENNKLRRKLSNVPS